MSQFMQSWIFSYQFLIKNSYLIKKGNNYYEIKIFDLINSIEPFMSVFFPLYQNATYYYELDGIPLISNDLDTASIITGQFDII